MHTGVPEAQGTAVGLRLQITCQQEDGCRASDQSEAAQQPGSTYAGAHPENILPYVNPCSLRGMQNSAKFSQLIMTPLTTPQQSGNQSAILHIRMCKLLLDTDAE